MHFLNRQYTLTLENSILDRIEKLRIWRPHAYHPRSLLSSLTDHDQAQVDRWDSTGLIDNVENSLWPVGWGTKIISVLRQTLLPAVAGSGSHSDFFNYLSVNVGHYLVSGKVSSEDMSTTTFLNHYRRLTSQDTKFFSEVKGPMQ